MSIEHKEILNKIYSHYNALLRERNYFYNILPDEPKGLRKVDMLTREIFHNKKLIELLENLEKEEDFTASI